MEEFPERIPTPEAALEAPAAEDMLEPAAEEPAAEEPAAEEPDRKSTRLNSSHIQKSRMPSSA